jgi:hypothetical protein
MYIPAAERNCAPILEQLRALLPGREKVLEIASSSAQHVSYLEALPRLTWEAGDLCVLTTRAGEDGNLWGYWVRKLQLMSLSKISCLNVL